MTHPSFPDLSTFPLFSLENSVAAVNARIAADTEPRTALVMQTLVKHLHAFVEEVALTNAEWATAIDFLTKTGAICSAERQEFILLSDTLGVSMLVDAINNQRPAGATENTVLGPFHVADAPQRAMGDDISLDGLGEPCEFVGRIVDIDGRHVANATIDVWSDNADGFYDVQQPEIQPKWNNRGIFVTGPDGQYAFRGRKPVSYPIPYDGPVGQMLLALGRHPYRPAHMHFIVKAPGYQRVITHTFSSDDAYLASDAVFGVKQSLLVNYERVEGNEPAWQSAYDFVLVPADEPLPKQP